MIDHIPFVKMHGLGNDFVIINKQDIGINLDNTVIRYLADRREGIGCDQVILVDDSTKADRFVRIFNADASESGMCGNALRCVGLLIMAENETDHCTIQLNSGIYHVTNPTPDEYTVVMGKGSFEWQDIPIASAQHTSPLDFEIEGLGRPYALSIGNPHLVFWVEDVNDINLETLGESVAQNPLFPEGINVEIVQILDPNTILMRVWERGVGISPACGSGACAVALASLKAQKTGPDVNVYMPGGILKISIAEDGDISMTGQATLSFVGNVYVGFRDDND